MKKYDIAIFDLDGTLSESGEGIIDSVKEVFRRTNKPLPSKEDLSKFIGPPMYDSLIRCGFSHEEAERGVDIYKESFIKSGIYKNKTYEGMREVLAELKENGIVLAVATGKYEPFACKIINMLGLDGFFDFVGGSTSDSTRRSKEKIINYCLENLNAVSNSRVIMIGDTKFDAQAAKETGCDFIGALYGYGTKEEMESFFPNAVFVNSPKEIKNMIC